jgi:hypothetical protein
VPGRLFFVPRIFFAAYFLCIVLRFPGTTNKVDSMTQDQALQILRELPSRRRRELLYEFASEHVPLKEKRAAANLVELRKLAREQGQDWDTLSDESRVKLIDILIHQFRGR